MVTSAVLGRWRREAQPMPEVNTPPDIQPTRFHDIP
jgi:hypothetical protein